MYRSTGVQNSCVSWMASVMLSGVIVMPNSVLVCSS